MQRTEKAPARPLTAKLAALLKAMVSEREPLPELAHILPYEPALPIGVLKKLRMPAEGKARKLEKAVSLLVTPLSSVSTLSSMMFGTLNPIGQTEEPSVLDQLACLKLPVGSTVFAQS